MATNLHVIWFKRDLRIHDHKPLIEASKAGLVLPLYVVEPELWRQSDSSFRHWNFIHDSLMDLDQAFRSYGGKLIVRVGNILSILDSLHAVLGSFVLYSHEETGNGWTYQRDIHVSKWCQEKKIVWKEFPSNGVVRRLKTRDDWSSIRNERMAEPLLLAPEFICFAKGIESSPLPSKTDSLFGKVELFAKTQPGGRSKGIYVLDSFLEKRSSLYIKTLSKPGLSAQHSSRLSPHIAYGTLSIREIEQATKKKIQDLKILRDQPGQRNLSAFLSRLAWRCHFVQKMEQQPSIETACMHSSFEEMREPFFREDYFEAWKYGRTGYPLVDACMRSLIQNGWINFRIRAMLVSFASYDLWLDWRKTAPYLAQLFTDYEPGIHYSQFQMQSGVTGINATRIYNPVKQSVEQDPAGKFIRRYIPELKNVPDAFIHTPWLSNVLPPDYPVPIVEHEIAMREARRKLSERFRQPDFKKQAAGVQKKLGSRKQTSSKAPKEKKEVQQTLFDLYPHPLRNPEST